ncbi:zf-HC2 domain-containing protein [Luedemannella helvata]|uniref:Zf-HC2 domain-containing protein n=1 Tax=Luedemannella helvata TaxID=349315 RepID=A0ABN2JRG5_9ACTN
MSCPHAHDDGAYVLGALSAADRAAFEAHLSGCPTCREAVAQLAVLPGLLSRLSPDAAVSETVMPPSVLPKVLAAAAATRRRERRARHWWAVAATAAAAVFALAVGVGVYAFDGRPRGPVVGAPTVAPSVLPTPLVTMRPMTPVSSSIPVIAELGIRPTPDGTHVEMMCGYIKRGEYLDRVWTLDLFVWPISGEPEKIATWSARAGDEMRMSTRTHFPPAEIARVELRSASGRTLMTWTPT